MEKTATKIRCADCGTEKDGGGKYCVLCFANYYRRCPECTEQLASGFIRIRTDKELARREKRPARHINCKRCNNERWIVD